MRNRIRLWLRSERAFGLSSVRIAPSESWGLPQRSGIRFADGEVREREIRDSEEAGSPKIKSSVSAAATPAARGSLFGEVGLSSDMTARARQTATATTKPMVTVEVFDAPSLSTQEKTARLTALQNNEVRDCTKCRLCEGRAHTVPGEGPADARLMVIGEGPGRTEDETGRPCV